MRSAATNSASVSPALTAALRSALRRGLEAPRRPELCPQCGGGGSINRERRGVEDDPVLPPGRLPRHEPLNQTVPPLLGVSVKGIAPTAAPGRCDRGSGSRRHPPPVHV